MVVGAGPDEAPAWERLEKAFETLFCSDVSEECTRFERACGQAMMDAGVEPQWVRADFQNIEELLSGQLGPMP